MNKTILTYGTFFALLISLAGCTGTRHLGSDEYLFHNGGVVVKSEDPIKNFREIKAELKKQGSIKHNSKILWMRPRISLYNTIKEPKKKKGLKHWLKYKIGKAPYIYHQAQEDRIKASMKSYLFDNSYFSSTVKSEVNYKGQQAAVKFMIHTGKSYKISKLTYKSTGAIFDSVILARAKNTDIHIGEPYRLQKLVDERKELAFSLMNQGYYYFRPDYFVFSADTTNDTCSVDLTFKIKPSTPLNAFTSYLLNDVSINDDYSTTRLKTFDTTLTNGIRYQTNNYYVKPHVVANTVHLTPDGNYNRDNHLRTLNHIRSLQMYQFVGITYTQDDSLINRLNAVLDLYPMPKMSFSGELNANIKSNNFAGPGVLFSFTNRNTFKSAELLNLSFGGRFETQYTGTNAGNTSYEVRVDGGLSMPRLYPLRSKRIKKQNIPSTTINLGMGMQERVEWYRMLNFNFSLNYNWRRNEKISHRFSLLDINVGNLLNTTDTFKIYLDANPSVRRSFEEQFIFGFNYNFYYSSSADRLNTPFFIGFTFDPSGILLGGVSKLVTGRIPNNEDPYEVFGLPYAEYVRAVIDIRKTFYLGLNNSIATRLNIGAGMPFGNSFVMPYIKQFYMGGTNSLRGFQARSVGPGSFASPDSTVFFDQAGDIKIEMNFEYRFPLWGILESAFFIDAGNIWLVNEDSTRPGGKFFYDTFLSQMAMSAGVGLRINFNPIIIRFDWGWPIRFPFAVDGESNWVVGDINFANSEWRKRNLVFNISLGYPF